jgi:hypothetical protein
MKSGGLGNKSSFKPGKIRDVPPNESFVQHWSKLIESRAWRSLSRYAFLALFRLEAEHCNHAGKENGWLIVTYDQFDEWGIPRKWIKPAITELVNAKLVVIERQGRAAKGDGVPTLYRLTYLKFKFVPATGSPQYFEPSSDWQVLENPKVPIPDHPKPDNNNLSSLKNSRRSVPALGTEQALRAKQKTVFSVPALGTKPVPALGTEQTARGPNSANPLSTCVGNYYLHYGVDKGQRGGEGSISEPLVTERRLYDPDRRFLRLAGCVRRGDRR